MNPYTPQGQAEFLERLQNNQASPVDILLFWLMFSSIPSQLYPFIQNISAFIQTYSMLLISGFLLPLLIYFAAHIYIYKKTLEEKKVILQIIPPDDASQSPLSTREFFTSLHDVGMYSKTYFKIFHTKRKFALELVATREEGIRYFIVVPEEDASIITKTLVSYLPEVKVIMSDEYIPVENNEISHGAWTSIADIILRNDSVFPLSEKKLLAEHDPIGFLTGQMTKLNHEEMILLQIIVSPISSKTHRKLAKKLIKVYDAVQSNFSLNPYLKQPLVPRLAWLPFRIIRFIFLFTIGLVFWQINLVLFLITFGGIKMLIVEVFRRHDEIIKLSPAAKQLYIDISSKLQQGLFETTIRLFIAADTKNDISLRQRGIMSGFATFDYPNYQLLEFKSPMLKVPQKLRDRFNVFKLINRQLSLQQNPVLSISEISNLYHLPYAPTTKTEGLVKAKFKTLPAPLVFKKRNPILDIQFGINRHNGEETQIGLTTEERKRHLYIIGATGTGKTTLLSSMIHQDIQNGKGLCVIDPHGDLTQTILGSIPKQRIKDVVYFNPMDRAYPIGLNLLELRKDLSEEQIQDEKEIITSGIISVFHKLYTAKYFGPRMEHILRYAILAALETENPTLFTIQKLLTDKQYRNKLVLRLSDPVVKDFWLNEFKRMGSYQQAEMTAPITNKLGRFLSSPLCRNILGQNTSTIDFDKILNEGKILICALPKGSLGEDNSAFFGILITAKIQLAALHRVTIPEVKRREFYLYVDEFQNFATPSFAQILSEARKYGLSAILAHQTIAQIEDRNLTKVILANTGTNLCFRTSSPLDEEYILPIFKPQVKKGEIGNLPSFSFYCKINALKPYDTFSGETEPFSAKTSAKIMQTIISTSQQKYGVARKQVEDNIKRFYLNQTVAKSSLEKTAAKKQMSQQTIGSIME